MSSKQRRQLSKWPKRKFLKRISLAAIICCFLISSSVLGLSIYGNNVGNFVVSIEKQVVTGLALSEDNDFVNHSANTLYAEGLENITNATLANIPKDIHEYNGNYSDDMNHRFSSYSFYVKNCSSLAVSYQVKLSIDQVYKNVDDALRVMIIRDGEQKIFAKKNKDGSVPDHSDIIHPYSPIAFAEDSTPYIDLVVDFDVDQVSKYTIVFWLEGWDEDCTDDIRGGAIKMSMGFSVVA